MHTKNERKQILRPCQVKWLLKSVRIMRFYAIYAKMRTKLKTRFFCRFPGGNDIMLFCGQQKVNNMIKDNGRRIDVVNAGQILQEQLCS